MSRYTLYYWSVPFRGQFVRAVLAYAGEDWTEPGDDDISLLMKRPAANQPIPFIGPPVLVDAVSGLALSQMPAIVLYLGETLRLIPDTPVDRALTSKLVNDANDVIDELTLDGGRQMWTDARWKTFIPRLERWMSLWEETGRRRGLTPTSGFILGGEVPGAADVVTATLWTTLSDRFPAIGARLRDVAPLTAALSGRISALPALVALADTAKVEYGDAWSGGQIETSLRKVLGG